MVSDGSAWWQQSLKVTVQCKRGSWTKECLGPDANDLFKQVLEDIDKLGFLKLKTNKAKEKKP